MTIARTTWLSGLNLGILGNPGVGKNTFVQSFFNSPIDRANISTEIYIVNQLDNHVKWNYQFCNLQTKFNLRFNTYSNPSDDSDDIQSRTIREMLSSAFFCNLNIIFILFDVTNLQSFESLMYWYDEAKKYCSTLKFETVVIVGTKRDLVNQRKVTREQANGFALGLGFSYFEIGKDDDDDDDDTCIDRVYSIIARHLNDKVCKDFRTREKFLYLDLDSIISSSPFLLPPPKTTTTTTTKDQLFYFVFRSMTIRNNIFKQITKIHSDLNVQVARGIGIPNITFWCSNRYINVLKYYQKTKLPIEINNIPKLTSILRMPNNLELLQYILENIGRNLNQKEKNQIMNEVMVGGDLSMIQYLYSQEYYWTFEGLWMAIAFNHIDSVEFIIEKSGDVRIKEWFDLTNQSLEMCIGVAKSYNRKEIENELKKKQSLAFKLSNMFQKLRY
ncbi:hypothetical protein DFA_10041 [Cavenderia fasciculata]|uniref:Uncharacterized protein n=1 Tax=Cavenderia fasciculata TaxID=261658 RepID=F4Q942_CACFS|nr:uncharacterized protein DFA_10041 [Cavenderia fasciculata]EGG15211.1 hypothetical protein DFA_10041 [Cavenderia fasciculata]|eukprot:XP_004351931.1 hypothetical protein DFA_10041 [Cavenderia fasciculata]